MRNLRILTANLRNDRADPCAFAEILDALEIDVACVQELGPRLAEALARKLPEGALAPDRENRGLGIASRRPAKSRGFPLAGRDGIAARLAPADWSQLAEPIEIVNVHILAPQTWPYFPRSHTRGRQLAGLLEYLDADPQVPRALLGDFNATPLWPLYRRLAARLRHSVSVAGGGRHRTWPQLPALGLAGLIRIDHCFLSRLTAQAVRVVPLPGSDHLGLCVDVALERPA